MTCADTSVIARPPVSGQGERGANRKKEGLEEEERGERGAAEVTGGGSPQRDSRRQNVSGIPKERHVLYVFQPCRESAQGCD